MSYGSLLNQSNDFTKYGQYCWKKEELGLSEGQQAELIIADSSYSDSRRYVTFNYSSTANVDNNGKVVLTGSVSSINIGYKLNDTTSVLNGKYFTFVSLSQPGAIISNAQEGVVYKGYSNVSQWMEAAGGGYGAKITCAAVNSGAINTEYLFSTNQSAYPESGIIDGFRYTYLGIPIENILNAPKIVYGSYSGSGEYGQNNPNTLTFDFEPKAIFITINDTGSFDAGYYLINPQSKSSGIGKASQSNQTANLFVTWSGKTVSWYSEDIAREQLNESGKIYYYMAILA